MINKFYTVVLGLCFVFISNAQVDNQFSLEQAVAYGVENNYSLKSTKLESDIQRAQAFEVMTEGFPKINAKVDYTYNFEQQVSLVPAGVFGPEATELTFGMPQTLTVQADVTQLVFDARYIYGLKARKGLLEMADLREGISEIDTKEMISKAYYAALVADQSYTQLASTKGILDKILNETTQIYEVGLTDELSVNRLELNLSNLETQIESSRQQAENALLNLKFQMGMPQDENLTLTDNLGAILSSLSFQVDENVSVNNRIETELFSTLDDMRLYDIKQARSVYFPSIYAFANYGANAQRESFNFFNDQRWFDYGMVGVTLNVPIFDGLKGKSQVQQRKIQKEQNLTDLANFEEAFELQSTIMKNNLATTINQYNAQQENIALAQKILDKTVIMFNEGIGSSLELSQAQQDYTITQINYSQAIYNLLVAQIELKKALGNIE